MNNKSDLLLLVAAATSLIGGMVSYILFRVTPTHFELLMADLLGIPALLEIYIRLDQEQMHMLMTCYAADFFWMFSLVTGLFVLLKTNVAPAAVAFRSAFLSLLVGLLLELLQRSKVISGTFDFYDLITFLIAAVMAVIICIKTETREKKYVSLS